MGGVCVCVCCVCVCVCFVCCVCVVCLMCACCVYVVCVRCVVCMLCVCCVCVCVLCVYTTSPLVHAYRTIDNIKYRDRNGAGPANISSTPLSPPPPPSHRPPLWGLTRIRGAHKRFLSVPNANSASDSILAANSLEDGPKLKGV